MLGGGILVLPSLTLEIAGPASLIAWVIITLASLPIAMMFGYLSTDMPEAGGISYFAQKAFGRHTGNVTGWLYFFLLPSGQPAVMLAGVLYFDYMFGFSRESTLLMAYGILSAAITLAMFGKRITAKVQFGIMAAILLIVVMTLILGTGSVKQEHFFPIFPNGYWAVGEALGLILWAYIGIENLSFLAADFENPKRDFLRSLIVGMFLTGLIYISISWVTIGVINPSEWGQVKAPFAHIVNQVSGIEVVAIAMLIGLFIVSASAMAFVWGGSNLCIALTQQKALPDWLLIRKGDIPFAALLFLWALYTLAFLLIYVLNLNIVNLAKFVGASTLITYILCGLAHLKLLKKGRWSSIFTLFISIALLPFFGWALLYPVITILLYFSYAFWRYKSEVRENSIHYEEQGNSI